MNICQFYIVGNLLQCSLNRINDMSSFEHMFDLQELHINHANMITEIIVIVYHA